MNIQQDNKEGHQDANSERDEPDGHTTIRPFFKILGYFFLGCVVLAIASAIYLWVSPWFSELYHKFSSGMPKIRWEFWAIIFTVVVGYLIFVITKAKKEYGEINFKTFFKSFFKGLWVLFALLVAIFLSKGSSKAATKRPALTKKSDEPLGHPQQRPTQPRAQLVKTTKQNPCPRCGDTSGSYLRICPDCLERGCGRPSCLNSNLCPACHNYNVKNI